jgi:WD40 repeat protein
MSVAFSPDGKQLISGSWDNTMKLWDVDTGARRPLAGHKTVMPGGLTVPVEGHVTCVGFSPDGKLIVSCCETGPSAKLWNAKTGAPAGELRAGATGLDWAAFSPDGKLLAICCTHLPAVQIWDATTQKLVRSMEGPGRCRKTVFSDDGTQLLGYCSHGYGVFVWDTQSGKLLKRNGPEEMSRDPIAQFSGDGTLLATRTRSWEAIVWDPRSGQKLYPLPGPQPQMHCFCFSADKNLLAIGSGAQKIVRLWELPAIDERSDETNDGVKADDLWVGFR